MENNAIAYNRLLEQYVIKQLARLGNLVCRSPERNIRTTTTVVGHVLFVAKQIYFAKYGKRFRQGYHDYSWEEYQRLKKIIDIMLNQ